MASIKTKFAVGLFVVTGLAVAFVAIIWLGTSHYFEKGQLYSAYFDESVQGLSKDSPVKYRGVTIGRVQDILVAPDTALIEIVIKIESGLKPDKEVVAQLKSVGITGIMFVELDRKKKWELDHSPKIGFPPRHTVIDTKPSEIKRFMDSLNLAISQINRMDLEGISIRSKAALDKLNAAISEAKIRQLSSDIKSSLDKWDRAMESIDRAGDTFNLFTKNTDKTVSNLNDTIKKLDNVVADNRDEIAGAIRNFNNAVNDAGKLIREGTVLVQKTDYNISSIQRQVSATMQSIEKTSESLNRSIDIISDQPAMLLFGTPPPEKETEK
ncbi:MAG: MlaD family protein [Desulfobacterales bacterium]|nr:MlaD family protein [Desulfobacterales bacterium]